MVKTKRQGPPEQISSLARQYAGEVRIQCNGIVRVFLYGSYARGDYDENSDIDIMYLTDDTDELLLEEKVSNITFDYNMEYDVEISPIIVKQEHFDYWKESYMFYRNIVKEGILIE